MRILRKTTTIFNIVYFIILILFLFYIMSSYDTKLKELQFFIPIFLLGTPLLLIWNNRIVRIGNWENTTDLFLYGFLLAGILLELVIIFSAFYLFIYSGGETINEFENQQLRKILLISVISISSVIITRYIIFRERKQIASGMNTLILIVFLFSCYNYAENYVSNIDFDQQAWNLTEEKPLNMSATLFKKNKLIDLNRNQVTDMLGEGFEKYNKENNKLLSIIYLVEGGWKLTIYFTNDHVIKVELKRPSIMT